MKSQKAAPLPNPYFNARRSWNDHVGQVVSAIKIWQTIGVLSLLIAALALCGIVSIAKQSRFVPYIVEVDKLGQVAAIQPASVITGANLNSVIKASLASFITKARLVTPDQQLQANSIREVYASLANSDPATAKMTEWYNGSKDSSPFSKAAKILVNASITAIIQQSPDSWQVDWTETTTTRQGEPQGIANMRAIVTVYVVPPTNRTSEDEIRKNPIGLYIKDINWTKVGI